MEETTSTGLGAVIDQAKEALPKLLDMGTDLFEWLLSNPLFILGIIFFIIITVIGIVKRAR